MKTLLKKYIQRIVREAIENSNNDKEKDLILQSEDELKEEDELEEFSGAGAVGGYSLPLGMSPDDAGRKKNKIK